MLSRKDGYLLIVRYKMKTQNQKTKGKSTAYVEDVLRRTMGSDKYSLDMIEELVQQITINGKITYTVT